MQSYLKVRDKLLYNLSQSYQKLSHNHTCWKRIISTYKGYLFYVSQYIDWLGIRTKYLEWHPWPFGQLNIEWKWVLTSADLYPPGDADVFLFLWIAHLLCSNISNDKSQCDMRHSFSTNELSPCGKAASCLGRLLCWILVWENQEMHE